MKTIDVIGCHGDEFSASGAHALTQAEIIVATSRHLKNPLLPELAEKIVLDGNILGILPALIARSKTKQMAFIASGDPLYCGIGATLLRFVPAKRLRILPAATAFQHFFAALGQPWEQAELFSLHARGDELPHRQILRAQLCAIYGDARRPAQTIARELIEAYPAAAKRKAAAGCNLGYPEEIVLQGTLKRIAESPEASASLSVLALLPDETADYPPLPLGLPDDHYLHFKNMITHPEVRAIVLSKLRLAPGIMWDLGAGSGSVGLEAAALCPGLAVLAVEKNDLRFGQLHANIHAEGIANITAYQNDAITLMPELPAPDRIFIGGGGQELLEESFAYLRNDGILVMTGVMIDSIALMGKFKPEFRSEFLSVNISRTKEITPDGFMLWAENPVTIAVWQKSRGK